MSFEDKGRAAFGAAFREAFDKAVTPALQRFNASLVRASIQFSVLGDPRNYPPVEGITPELTREMGVRFDEWMRGEWNHIPGVARPPILPGAILPEDGQTH